MPAFICTACGTQYASTEAPPALCTICQEERQYVPPGGQSWSTLEALASSHFNSWRQHEPGILGIGTVPHFAIGQRAILVCTPRGNVLWDCISLIDDATVSLIKGLGGVQAIAISHPHFYTSMAEWSRALDAPIHLHVADRDWIMRPDPAVRLWEGDTLALLPDITLIRAGGHFPGGTVLHWANGAEGRGVVCSGDILTVTTDRKFLSFMRSYPNLIPLGPPQIAGIAQAMEPFRYDRIYGHYFDRVIPQDAKEVMRVSVARYLAAISGERYHKG